MRVQLSLLCLALCLVACSSPGNTQNDRPADGGNLAGDEPETEPLPPHPVKGFGWIDNGADLEALPSSTRAIWTGESGSPYLGDVEVKQLARFSKLERLKLVHCRGITDEGLAVLARLTNLRELDLSGCTAITDDGVSQLEALGKMRLLTLNFCPKVTKPAIRELERALPRADIIWSSDDPPLGAAPDYRPK